MTLTMPEELYTFLQETEDDDYRPGSAKQVGDMWQVQHDEHACFILFYCLLPWEMDAWQTSATEESVVLLSQAVELMESCGIYDYS